MNSNYWSYYDKRGHPILPPISKFPAQVYSTSLFYITEGDVNSHGYSPSRKNPERWKQGLLSNVTQVSSSWDIMESLTRADSNFTISTDGGSNSVRGYYGWVMASDFSVLVTNHGVMPAHSSQLNSLRPETTALVSALVFLTEFIGHSKVKIGSRINHIADNLTLVSRVQSYYSSLKHTPKSVSRSDMDAHLQAENLMGSLYGDQHSTMTSFHIKGIKTRKWGQSHRKHT